MLNLKRSKYSCAEFYKEIENDGYAIFSKIKARQKGYYPTELPKFDDIDISDIKPDDVLKIRTFIKIGQDSNYRVDSGLIDVEIEFVDGKEIWGCILTKLPPTFPIQKGNSIELDINELLYFVEK